MKVYVSFFIIYNLLWWAYKLLEQPTIKLFYKIILRRSYAGLVPESLEDKTKLKLNKLNKINNYFYYNLVIIIVSAALLKTTMAFILIMFCGIGFYALGIWYGNTEHRVHIEYRDAANEEMRVEKLLATLDLHKKNTGNN